MDKLEELLDNGVGTLGVPPPLFNSHFEITLTHPHTTKWLNLPSNKQKTWFRNTWNKLINTCGIPHYSKYALEYHKNGHVHLHGMIIPFAYPMFSIEGAILDYVRKYNTFMPLKWSNVNMKNFFIAQQNYTSTPIKVNYVNHIEQPARMLEWVNYINKDQ